MIQLCSRMVVPRIFHYRVPKGAAGTLVTARLIARLIRDGAKDFYVRQKAIQIFRAYGVHPKDQFGEAYALFGAGGGKALAGDLGVQLVGEIPLEPAVSTANDAGTPLSVAAPASAAGAEFARIAARIADDLLPPVDMGGCTARVLAAAKAALGGS